MRSYLNAYATTALLFLSITTHTHTTIIASGVGVGTSCEGIDDREFLESSGAILQPLSYVHCTANTNHASRLSGDGAFPVKGAFYLMNRLYQLILWNLWTRRPSWNCFYCYLRFCSVIDHCLRAPFDWIFRFPDLSWTLSVYFISQRRYIGNRLQLALVERTFATSSCKGRERRQSLWISRKGICGKRNLLLWKFWGSRFVS